MKGLKVIWASTDENPAFPERNGQEVEVLRELTAQKVTPDAGPMFEIRFADGVTTDAFLDELQVSRV